MFEAPELKVVRFECKDVIATSNEGPTGPTGPTGPGDWGSGTGSGGRVKGISGIVSNGKVSWD